MGSRRTPGLETISKALSLKEQGRGDEFKQTQRDASLRAGELFKAGDTKGALGELAVFPAGQQAIGNLISGLEQQEPGLVGRRAFETEASKRKAALEFPLSTDIKSTSLSGPTLDAFVRGEKAIADFQELTSLGTQLIDEDKVGLLTGQFTQIRSLLGLSDPTEARFIGLRELMTVGIAARENDGRPSKEDQAAIGKFIGGVAMNPAALYEVLNMGLSKQERDVAKQFIIFRRGTTDKVKQRLIEETALAAGINLKDLDAADEIEKDLKDRKIQAKGTRRKIFTAAHILGIRNMFKNLTPASAKRLTPGQKERMNIIGPLLRAKGLL